jgi:glycerol-3-phosphate O-acyltransferase
VIFMPVYFGYERIVEGRTYIGELSGRPKEKESVIGLLRAIASVLRSKFGRVHVNLGQPIALESILHKHHPGWRSGGPLTEEARPAWITAVIDDLAHSIAAGINAAAAVTPVNLVAMAKRLLHDVPYGPLVTVTGESGAAMICTAERMGMLERQRHPLGDIMRMRSESAVLATYYRNNILHLFALPSLIACCFISNARVRTVDLKRLVWRVYPYIAAELFLEWEETRVPAVLDSLLDLFARLNLLETNPDRSEWQRPAPTSLESIRLSLLAESTIQTIERYYLVIALLLQAGSNAIGQEALEKRCHLMAQRMSVLYGLDSPEFFDTRLFRNFIALLLKRNVVQTSADGNLQFGELLMGVSADAQLVLSEQIRTSILQVTLGQ